jgi:hypothetical protein
MLTDDYWNLAGDERSYKDFLVVIYFAQETRWRCFEKKCV